MLTVLVVMIMSFEVRQIYKTQIRAAYSQYRESIVDKKHDFET